MATVTPQGKWALPTKVLPISPLLGGLVWTCVCKAYLSFSGSSPPWWGGISLLQGQPLGQIGKSDIRHLDTSSWLGCASGPALASCGIDPASTPA